MKPRARVLVAMFAAGAGMAAHGADAPRDALAEGFRDPPADARPLVFWQWVNGNVSEQGIRLDLEWMHRIGIAGAVMFDIGFRSPPVPQYVEKRVGFGTDEWRHAVAFAGAEAKRLGLLLGAQSSGGWSVSGDPTVRPEQAMKKLVWSETLVAPDTPQSLRLPAPPDVSGPYQDMPIGNAEFLEPRASGAVAVIGVRLPEVEREPAPRATLRSDAGSLRNGELLDDGSFARSAEIVPDERGYAIVEAQLPIAPRSLTIGFDAGRPIPRVIIEASRDGVDYHLVEEFPKPAAQPSPAATFFIGYNPDLHWRVIFPNLDAPLRLTELRFDIGARMHRVQERSGYGTMVPGDWQTMGWVPGGTQTMGSVPEGTAIDASEIIDLTTRVTADGQLNWRPTQGQWTVLRFGWSLTGRRTVPATDESRGLEVDKLDAAAVRAYAEGFYARYGQATDGGPLSMAFTDSWEAGQQNWTPTMPEEFARRRGYDLRPWLPVIAGHVVGDSDRSERFLADFRRTISELLVENHYGVLADVAHRRGMQYVAEAPGTGMPTLIDGLAAKGLADIPAGEFWTWPIGGEPDWRHVADVQSAASAAHIYGRTQVAAESLTSDGADAWALGPAQLRRMVDRFFAEGVNRVILHTSVHQPFADRAPGITLRQYGQHFTRNETWAGDAGAWIDYLARCSFLLQQGKPVADVAVYQGEVPPFTDFAYAGPDGLSHDLIDTANLLKLEVQDGQLVLPNGLHYQALEMTPTAARTGLPVIRKLKALLEAGAMIVGRKAWPQGLADEKEIRAVSDELWGEQLGKVELAWNHKGSGFLFTSWRFANEVKPLPRDVEAPSAVHWVHRRTGDADIYFVSNQSEAAFHGAMSFRVRGRNVELWDAVDGSRSPAAFSAGELTTSVSPELAPFGSKFVVFRGQPAPGNPPTGTVRSVLTTLQGPWDVEFLDGRGAPRRARLAGSWTDHSNAGIRYYSGRARYLRTIDVPGDWLAAGRRIELDLGEVAEIAHVRINDVDLGAWWLAPFRRDISAALHAGRNRLEIVVTNYWVNRLVGDEQPGAKRWTFAPIHPYQANSPLRRSGLLGPVQLLSVGDLP